VVLTLVKPLLGQGYCVHMDNFYSNQTLFDKPVESKTAAIGTGYDGMSLMIINDIL